MFCNAHCSNLCTNLCCLQTGSQEEGGGALVNIVWYFPEGSVAIQPIQRIQPLRSSITRRSAQDAFQGHVPRLFQVTWIYLACVFFDVFSFNDLQWSVIFWYFQHGDSVGLRSNLTYIWATLKKQFVFIVCRWHLSSLPATYKNQALSLRATLPANAEARRRIVSLARSVQMDPLPKAKARRDGSFQRGKTFLCIFLWEND